MDFHPFKKSTDENPDYRWRKYGINLRPEFPAFPHHEQRGYDDPRKVSSKAEELPKRHWHGVQPAEDCLEQADLVILAVAAGLRQTIVSKLKAD